ncbi:MAG: retropepsin-like aspartic protease family protein [Geminicoccaceae bacterium]
MLGWALRCLCLTVIGGLAFIGLQSGGLFEHMQVSPGADSRPSAEDVGGEGGNSRLEEVVRAGAHGHFIIDVHINGTPVTFLIDTGASHNVLNRRDADRLRLAGGSLRYTVPFESANGTVYAAPVTLRDVRLGQFQLYDLDAFVNQGDLGISLLGVSFLRRFESYEFLRDRLILRW